MVDMGHKLINREPSSDMVEKAGFKGRTILHCFIKELIHLSLG